MRRLGKHALGTLAILGNPALLLLTPRPKDQPLVALGYCKALEGGALCITPAGLRRLADEIEAGRVKGAEQLGRERRVGDG